jgi:hypothetical protein
MDLHGGYYLVLLIRRKVRLAVIVGTIMLEVVNHIQIRGFYPLGKLINEGQA